MTRILPRLRGTGSHRADGKVVAELRDENVRHLNRQAATDDFFAILQADRADVYRAWQYAERRRQEAETVAACALENGERLAAEHAAVIARIEARHAETVRGLERELQEARERLAIACKAETAVTRTQELSVEEIRRHCTPVPLHQSPMAQAVNPAHVPAWAVRD